MAQISIIVPVYNTEKFLAQCLDSICRQTLNNLEFLVIDDGSTDRSGAICDEYAARDPRIKVFHTENHGLSAARNLGLEYARKNGSTYIARYWKKCKMQLNPRSKTPRGMALPCKRWDGEQIPKDNRR